jgi:hypothetical protein
MHSVGDIVILSFLKSSVFMRPGGVELHQATRCSHSWWSSFMRARALVENTGSAEAAGPHPARTSRPHSGAGPAPRRRLEAAAASALAKARRPPWAGGVPAREPASCTRARLPQPPLPMHASKAAAAIRPRYGAESSATYHTPLPKHNTAPRHRTAAQPRRHYTVYTSHTTHHTLPPYAHAIPPPPHKPLPRHPPAARRSG